MNKVIITGRLTHIPELRTTTSGKSVVEFTVAVDRFAKGEPQVDFIRCTAWDKAAENLCRYKTSGDQIGVVGSLHTDKYTDVRGNNKYKTNVAVKEIEYYGNKKKEEIPDIDESELPFN